jgi:diguanylate cyclase (GGDEF)-like protein
MTGLGTALARYALALLVLLCLAGPAGASAATDAERSSPSCHGYTDAMLPMAEALAKVEWTCADGNWADGRAVTWLRFDQWHRDSPPHVFTSRMTVFRGARVAAVDADGTVRVIRYGPEDARPLLAGPLFALPLPVAGPQTRAFVVAIERPHAVTVASEAHLQRQSTNTAPLVALVMLSIVVGMLVMPLLFDLLFFVVLRERFVLMHGAMTISMFVYVLTSGGVITAFVELPVPLLAVLGPLSWTLGMGFAGFFIGAFLEPDMLSRRMRIVLHTTTALATLGAVFCSLQFRFSQPFDNWLYFWCFVPLLPVFVAAILGALFRGSRAAMFLTAAWVPLLVASLDRLLRGLGYYTGPSSIDQALFFALGLEVIVVALGVGDRFFSIRRERDQAVTRARMMKQLSERDSLTGLLNRRVIEERYALLRQEGFDTLAVLDLDHFKRINDTFGHALGDRVLRVVGRVLDSGDEDVMAFRMGGEEFMLLLRGTNAMEKAEHRRQEISRAVAHEDIGCLVTASMGIVETTGGALQEAGFVGIYARADRLLYEAKSSGRNRTVSERIKAFQPRRGDRRAA